MGFTDFEGTELMGIEQVRCTMCGKVMGTITDVPRWNAIPDEVASEAQFVTERSDVGESCAAECFDICAKCVACIDARFWRRDMSGQGTLAELLVEHFATFTDALLESRDSDIREVLPRLPREILPRRRKWKREQARIKAVLSRIGKPVCWYDPTLAKNRQGPFWLFQLHHESGEVCHALIDYFDVAELEDYANALDYAPDGSPLLLPIE
jgi:hypothetical protein